MSKLTKSLAKQKTKSRYNEDDFEEGDLIFYVIKYDGELKPGIYRGYTGKSILITRVPGFNQLHWRHVKYFNLETAKDIVDSRSHYQMSTYISGGNMWGRIIPADKSILSESELLCYRYMTEDE